MSDAGDIGRERRRWAQIEPPLCGVWTELYLGSWGAGSGTDALVPRRGHDYKKAKGAIGHHCVDTSTVNGNNHNRSYLQNGQFDL